MFEGLLCHLKVANAKGNNIHERCWSENKTCREAQQAHKRKKITANLVDSMD
jgi:uncharacterized membrane protein